MAGSDESSTVLRLPFVFVPHGAPGPEEWRARHPGWISIPATLILPAGSKRQPPNVVPVRDMVPATPGKPASQPNQVRNPERVDSFFTRAHGPLAKLAQELGLPESYILGLAAHESFWMDPHNTRLNNPFGLTAGGGNNLSFSSVEEAISYWVSLYGNQVRGARSPEDFAARLLGELDGARVPGWRRYNSVDPAWRQKVLAVIATIERCRPLWSGPR